MSHSRQRECQRTALVRWSLSRGVDTSGSYPLYKCSTRLIFAILRASNWTRRPPPRPYDWRTTCVVSHELQRLKEELALTQLLSRVAGAPAGGPALAFSLSVFSRSLLESTGNVPNVERPE